MALSSPETSQPAPVLLIEAECAIARAKTSQLDADSPPPGQSLPAPPAIAQLVHDLNNAMTAINGFADILLARLPADEPTRTCAEQIRKAGTRATALVNRLAHQAETSHGACFATTGHE